MILVDYTCRDCGHVNEHWAPSPPPATTVCPSCGDQARRLFAPVGLNRTAGHRDVAPAAAAPRRGPKLCNQYPQVPGLCHMSESAGRMWVAKYQNDHRAVDAELARQESRAREKPPTLADAVTHQHFDAATTPAAAAKPVSV